MQKNEMPIIVKQKYQFNLHLRTIASTLCNKIKNQSL